MFTFFVELHLEAIHTNKNKTTTNTMQHPAPPMTIQEQLTFRSFKQFLIPPIHTNHNNNNTTSAFIEEKQQQFQLLLHGNGLMVITLSKHHFLTDTLKYKISRIEFHHPQQQQHQQQQQLTTTNNNNNASHTHGSASAQNIAKYPLKNPSKQQKLSKKQAEKQRMVKHRTVLFSIYYYYYNDDQQFGRTETTPITTTTLCDENSDMVVEHDGNDENQQQQQQQQEYCLQFLCPLECKLVEFNQKLLNHFNNNNNNTNTGSTSENGESSENGHVERSFEDDGMALSLVQTNVMTHGYLCILDANQSFKNSELLHQFLVEKCKMIYCSGTGSSSSSSNSGGSSAIEE